MAIVRVQGNKRVEGGSGYYFVYCTLDSAPISGNVLVAVITTYASTPPTVDNIYQHNVTWNYVIRRWNDSLYGRNVEIWFGVVGDSPSDTAIINFTYGASISTINMCEYSGVATVDYLDQTASDIGSWGTNQTTGEIDLTAFADELWIGGIVNVGYEDATISNNTGGFTFLDGTGSFFASAYLEKIVSSVGNAFASTTCPANTYEAYAGVLAAFKAGSGPPPVPEVPYDIDVNTILTPTINNDIDVSLTQLDITRDNDIDTLLQKLNLTTSNDIDSIINLVQILPNDIDLILQRFDIEKTDSINVLLQALGITTSDSIDVLVQMLNLSNSKYIDFVIKGALINKNIDVDLFRFGVTNSKTIDTILDNFLLKGRMNAAKESLISKIQAYDSTLVVMDAWRLNKWDFDAQTENLVSIKIMPSRMNRLSYGSMITESYFGQYYSYHFTLHVLAKYDDTQTIHAKNAMDIANGIVNYLRVNQQDTNKGVLSILDITARESDPYGMTRGGAFMARIIVEGVMFCERPYKYKSEVV